VPFKEGVDSWELFTLQEGGWCEGVMCLSGRGLVVLRYVPIGLGVGGRQLCALLVRGSW
jgi:hypothetical protein